MNENLKYKENLETRLLGLIRRGNFAAALKGSGYFLITVSLVLLIFILSEAAWNFSSAVRTWFFVILVSTAFSSMVYFVIIPLLKNLSLFGKPDIYGAAKLVGDSFPPVKDELLNALQLFNSDSHGYSRSLVDGAFRKAYQNSAPFDFRKAVDFSGQVRIFKYAAALALFVGVITFFTPGLNSSAFRLFNFGKEFASPPKFIFEITPGNINVTKGEDRIIKIKTIGEAPAEIILALKSAEQTEFEEKRLKKDSTGSFVYEALSIRNTFDYYAFAEGIKSELYRITVINRPVISNFKVKIIPPAYSGLPVVTQNENGNITALIGSKVNLEMLSTKELSGAKIIFGDSTEGKINSGENKLEYGFRVNKDNSYFISVKDKEGNENLNPVVYTVKALRDEFPLIEIVSPAQNINLNDDDRIPVLLKINDDYGFSGLFLHYRLTASVYEKPWTEFKKLEIPIVKNQKESDVYYVWDLSNLNLATEDVVTYYFEVFDNDNVSGPKSAKSPLYTARVPSLDELFADADNAQEKAEKELVETLKEAQKLKEEIEKISRELKQDSKEITWEEKEKIEKALDRFNKLEEKIDEIKKDLNEMQKELSENNLLSEETLQKYMELQELMDKMSSEEMKKAFEKMQEMLQNLQRNEVQKSVEDFKMNEEMFQKSIERTINLLKRLQVEQKVNELQKRTEEILEDQKEVNEKTGQQNLSDKNEAEKLASQQKEISDKLSKLEEEMKKLDEMMKELSDMPADEMEKMLEEMRKQQNEKKSNDASSQLKNDEKQSAMRNQEEISQNMQGMMDNLNNMQSSMMMQNQMQVAGEMMKIIDNLLSLSKEQEKLKEETKGLSQNSAQFNKNAQKQDELRRDLSRLLDMMSSLSQKTFAISPEMGKALGKAMSQMSQSMNAMQNRNSSLAVQSQTGSMESLNEAASMMKGAMDQMMSGGKGGGMMSLMQQLEQMAQQQMSLNQMTQMLQQGGEMSQEQMAQLQRLAQQQELIRKSLEQLNKESREAGQSKKLSSNLEEILKEMQEVVTGMETEKLTDELVRQQEKILSKLLDAQRSINERDFEKERESNTGKNVKRESPADLNFITREGKDRIKDELQKAIKEGYTKDYEDLIRRYYEAIQKEGSN